MTTPSMRDAHPVEQAVGIRWYASGGPGVGGRLRSEPEDFRVREIEAVDTAPTDADPGAYPHIVLRVTLRGWDTHDFAQALAGALGISRERVSWAGTKDKHAVTTQLFSVKGIDPGNLPDLGDADIEPIGRTGRPVLFGDLAGNEFEVVVREPDRPDTVDEVTTALRALLGPTPDPPAAASPTVAVPNYFGQQRFGSRRPVTHEIGLAIARGDWAGAVMAYVGNPSEREPAPTQEARALVDRTRDWPAALEAFPGHLGHERAMLHRLDERTDGGARDASAADYRAALEAVPTSLQQLFVNAAQSYLFNLIVSERLQRSMPLCRPVAGDVVCFTDRDAPAAVTVPDPDRHQRVTSDRIETVRRHCDRGRAFVTAPLVGTETALAEGEPGEIERAVLDDIGVAPADFDLPEEFHSSGTRRAIAVRTDLAVDREPLTFSFTLPPGSYATVVLREYLKVDPGAL